MNKKNLANGFLGSPVSASDTTWYLQAGYAETMPAPPFYLTVTPLGQLSTRGNSEIILVIARSGETLTVERAKNGTTARSFETGDIVSNGVYVENSTAVGDIFMSMRTTPADGRLFMDGSTYNKADWPLLYKLVVDNAAYGTTAGSPGSETFTLADFRERMPFGKSSSSPFTTLGGLGGNNTHNHTLAAGRAAIAATGSDLNINRLDDGFSYNVRFAASGGTVATGTIPFSTELFGSTDNSSSLPQYVLVNYEIIAG